MSSLISWQSPSSRRGATSLIIVCVLWELVAHTPQWFGFTVPFIGVFPDPVAVVRVWAHLVTEAGYWWSCYRSLMRVFAGFSCALLFGVPLGLCFATNRFLRSTFFPVFEILRPIPPIAWVPASIIFWPTQELSIVFVIFLGAFYTITLNTFNGAREIDLSVIQSARSMGSSRWYLFRRVVLPASLPSIVTGASIGMGITWEVVVAAEMISGGNGGASGNGLGLFMWNAYTAGNREEIVVGMLSIGIAGYLSSVLLRRFGGLLTPWLSRR